MPVEASQYEDLGPAPSGNFEDLGPVNVTASPSPPSAADDLRGMIPPGILAVAKAAIPLTKRLLMPHPSDVFTAASEAAKGGLPAAADIAYGEPGSTRSDLTSAIVPGVGAGRVAASLLDPLAQKLAGTAAGALEMTRPVTGLVAPASRMVKASSFDLGLNGMGGPMNKRRMADYILNGGNLAGGQEDVALPDTSSTAVNTATGLFNAAGNDPVGTTLALGAGEVAPAISDVIAKGKAAVAKKVFGGTPQERSLGLMRRVAAPTPGTKLAKNFDETVGMGMNEINKSYGTTGTEYEKFNQGGVNAVTRLGADREAMMQEATANGATVNGKSIKQSVSRVGDDPYYDHIDPEGAAYFKDFAVSIPTGPIPVETAQGIYSTIEKMLRRANKLAGDQAAALENSDKYQALQTIKDNIGRQLNEVMSRTPNEYLDNSRRFSSVYRIMDRVQMAEDKFANAGGGIKTWRDYVNPKNLFKSTLENSPQKDLKSAMRLAQRNPFSEQPVPPQVAEMPEPPTAESVAGPLKVPPETMLNFRVNQRFPSVRETPVTPAPTEPVNVVPEITPTPKLEPMDWEATAARLNATEPTPENFKTPGGMEPEATPIAATPKWIDDVLKAAVKPSDMIKDIGVMKKVVSGKLPMNDPKISGWADNIIKQHLVSDPASAEANLQLLEQGLDRKVNFPKVK